MLLGAVSLLLVTRALGRIVINRVRAAYRKLRTRLLNPSDESCIFMGSFARQFPDASVKSFDPKIDAGATPFCFNSPPATGHLRSGSHGITNTKIRISLHGLNRSPERSVVVPWGHSVAGVGGWVHVADLQPAIVAAGVNSPSQLQATNLECVGLIVTIHVSLWDRRSNLFYLNLQRDKDGLR